jgi:hypothetical protein
MKISCGLQANLELNFRDDVLGVAGENYRAHEFAAMDERIACEILVGLTFKYRVGGEIELCNQGLVCGRADEIVDVLADTIGIVPGDDGIEIVRGGGIGCEFGAIAIALHVVMANVVGVPDFYEGARQLVTARIVNLPGDDEWHARVAGNTQVDGIGGETFVERTEFIGRGGLVLLVSLEGVEHG